MPTENHDMLSSLPSSIRESGMQTVPFRTDGFKMLEDAMGRHEWTPKWTANKLGISRTKLYSWLDCNDEYIQLPPEDMIALGEITYLLKMDRDLCAKKQ